MPPPDPAPATEALRQLRATAAAWAADDPDPTTRAEVEALLAVGDDGALAELFGSRLQFGTAGLRGTLGPGPNRMNRALVRRAAAGLARYLQANGAIGGSVVIGFDARHQSDQFAADTAAVMAGAGITAHLMPGPLPTPLLAYAIRHLQVDAGIMVTASHNPAQYNGYKVYLGDGAQIIPPADQEISAQIASVGSLRSVALASPDDPRIVRLGADIVERYLDDALAQTPLGQTPAPTLEPGAGRLHIVYTAMHGVGGAVTTALLGRAGFTDVDVVAPQAQPDPDFPTVKFPNPEEPGALDMALALAASRGADVVLANDPDADRLGVAVPSHRDGQDGWRVLTGDEIGVLLADHVLRHTSGDERLVVTSIVSSTMLSRMAAAAGVHFLETLTGFKWLARSVDSHPGWRFAFGYEEALGYCVGSLVRDKDGITAALLFAQVAAALKASGRSVDDRLDDLARLHGAHVTEQWSSVITGPDGAHRIAAVMRQLVTSPPAALDGWPVTGVIDLHGPGTGLPPTEGVVLHVGDGARIIVRPSGTEPKIKVYFEVVRTVCEGNVGEARARGVATVARLKRAMAALTGLPE